MARREASYMGEIKNTTAQKQFTDREEPQSSFRESLENIHNRKYSILCFYGVGGIGKSFLQKHLKEAHLDKSDINIYSSVDFEKESDRKEHQALRLLADNFKSKFKIPFVSFDIAYIIYLRKTNPNLQIKKKSLPFLEEGGLLFSALNFANSIGGVLGFSLRLIEYIAKKIQDKSFDKEVQKNLSLLNDLQVDKIEEKLIHFFAHDLRIFQEKNPQKKLIIFLDTYEALWKNDRSDANFLKNDDWVRDRLVTELMQVLFVICGREKLRWEEDDASWVTPDKNGIVDLEQHAIGNLSLEDSIHFLNSCDINDPKIQKAIYSSSEGVPYYLDLSVDTFNKMKNRGEKPTIDSLSDKNKYKIFERFMRYLDKEEVATLKVLANARFFNKKLFKELVSEFKTGYPVTEMEQLTSFSFISKKNDDFFINDLMRNSLIDFQGNDNKKEVNNFLFKYYNTYLQGLDIKNIGIETIEALSEAFYHKVKLNDVKLLSQWYCPIYDIFFQAAKYNTLRATMMQLKEILENELGEEHPDTVDSYNNLATLYIQAGEQQQSLELFNKVLGIRKKILGEEHPDTASSYSNLAALYLSIGDFQQSLMLNLKSLPIQEKILGEEHPDTVTSYHNLAMLYLFVGDYKEALPLFFKVLDIQEKTLGKEHPNTASSYSNLAEFYYATGDYKEALPLHLKALNICEKTLGKEHPHTGNAYNSLGFLYKTLGDNKEALPFYIKAFNIREKTLGKEHADTGGSYDNLALLYHNMGDYKEALPMYLKALPIQEKTLGEEHPHTVISYNNLALLYQTMGDYKEALPLYLKALSIREKTLGKEHPDTVASYNNLEFLYSIM